MSRQKKITSVLLLSQKKQKPKPKPAPGPPRPGAADGGGKAIKSALAGLGGNYFECLKGII
jgi:hypothetical protein